MKNPPRHLDGRADASRRSSFLILVAAVTYLVVLCTFYSTARPSEHIFRVGPDGGDRVKIYLKPLSVDPVNASIETAPDLSWNRSWVAACATGWAGSGGPAVPASATCLSLRAA
jgi:hypothetical protein